MSNQIVISSGAKVRDLNGVLTGTSGIVSSVPLGAANGVATLDSGGKVPVSQLPSSVVTYLGTWNAATNTPTLVNGTGDAGDMYICNVAGTVNFGAGPVTFAVGDWVLYGSGTWQKSNGQNGTVTSVAVTESGDALTITGSPITTAGTINIGFAGTSGQYVNGAGGLTTFPSLTGFVPYTGATGSVDLGVYSLSAGELNIEKNGANTSAINFEQATGTSILGAGYTSIGPIGTDGVTFFFGGATNSLTFKNNLLSASRSYSLPDASGTIALTSNLSSYVPYTGATASVDLGAFSLTADTLNSVGIFSIGSGTQSGYIGIKQGTTFLGNISGYNSINANSTKFILISDIGSTNYKSASFQLSSLTNNTERTFTLPDLSGTLALLEGAQTFTGKKTFSNGVNITGDVILSGGTGYGGGIRYVQGIIQAYGSNETTTEFTDANSIKYYVGQGSGNYKNFVFDVSNVTLNATRTYNLPNASGTIALTSNLSGYLPLTGGTLTGALSGTSATFSGTLGVGLTSGYSNGVTIKGASDDYALTIAQSNSSTAGWGMWADTGGNFKLARYGTTYSSPALTISLAGLATFSQPATFSSSVTAQAIISTGVSTFTRSALTFTLNPSYGGGDVYTQLQSTGALALAAGGDNNRLYITSGGNVGIGTSSPNNTTSGRTVLDINGTSTSWINQSVSGSTISYIGANSTNAFWNTDGAYFLAIGTNNTERMRITSSGNVGIGTSSPATAGGAYRGLDIRGSGGGSIFLGDTSTAYGFLYADNGGYSIQSGNLPIIFYPNGVERMRITSGGNVLIGDTGDYLSSRLNLKSADSTSSTNIIACRNSSGTDYFRVRSDGYTYALGVYNNTTGSGANVFVGAGGDFLRSTSSLKYKNSIRNYDKGLDIVNQLRPVYYKGNNDGDTIFAGLIAEEVHELGLTEFVQYAEDGTPDALAYQNMIALAFKAIQEQQAQIEELKELIKNK